MNNLAATLSMNWPILALCAVALAVLFVVLRGSISGVQRSLADLRERQEKLGSRVGELDRACETISKLCADAVARVAAVERDVESRIGSIAAIDGDATGEDAPISMERFNAAAETLSQLARELDGFDARHGEDWLRIKGDIDEQGFQLRRVQQHMDKLFVSADAESETSASAN